MSQPFAGIRVLDFKRYIAGPYGTYQFALQGADVIKIDSPHGPLRLMGPAFRLRGLVDIARWNVQFAVIQAPTADR
jgi:crotonobetainyl-CoA:carnitine CoA-transferase CaiB-like acyl-CoA transferase